MRIIQWAKKLKGYLTTIKSWNMKVNIYKLKITNLNKFKTPFNKALSKLASRSRVLYYIKYPFPRTFKAKNQQVDKIKVYLLPIYSNMIQFNCLTQSLKRRIKTLKISSIRWENRWISSQIRLRNCLKSVRILDSKFTAKTLTYCL